MKTYRWVVLALFAAVLPAWRGAALAANTDGYVTFSMATTTNTPKAAQDPKNIAVVWVVNSSGKFVKTLCRHAQSEIQYLYKWIADRGSYTAVDGVTSATLNQPASHMVTWNCRDTNNVVVPDGVYYMRAEYTSYNGQGPYTTNYCAFTKGPSVFSTNYPDLKSSTGNFTNMSLSFSPAVGDIAIRAMTPTDGFANYLVSVGVSVTNLTTNTTSAFSLTLANLTTASAITSRTVFAVAGLASSNVVLTWNTAGLTAGTYRIMATAGPLAGETNTADNAMTNAVTLSQASHDIYVRSIVPTGLVPPNVISNVTVAVTNMGDIPESFSLTLADLNAGGTIGTRSIPSLAGKARTNVVFAWNTAGAALGFHTLQASSTLVPGEIQTANNTNAVTVIVASGLETNVFVAHGSTWKYLDAGLDISGAPWTQPATGYADGFWASGTAPLGYGLPQIATTVAYGPSPTNRNMTTYFRREFTADVMPLTVTGFVRRAHGVVIYLNGQELDRQNMPGDNPVSYGFAALSTVNVPAATNFVTFAVSPTNVLVGRNTLAAEVHLASPTNTGMAFDLELWGVSVAVGKTNSIVPLSVAPDGDVQWGDALGVSVTVSNRGNTATNGILLLRDAATGAIVASQPTPLLVAGETTVLRLAWPTLGVAGGSRLLQALTVINGVTNVIDTASNTVSVAMPDFSPRTVNAASSLGGWCGAVAVAGTTVYLGCGATLEAWDASAPGQAARLGSIRLPGLIEGLAVGSGVVFAAAGAAGLQCVDVSNPAAPVHVSTFDSSGHARRVALAGGLLYLADGMGGIRVLSVTNPAAPSLVGAYRTAGAAQSLALAPPYLMALDKDDGLQVIAVSSPTSMALTGACRSVTAGLGLALDGTAAFVSDAHGGLFRVDAANVAAPTNAARALLPAAGQALVVSGPALYVAAGPAGLVTVSTTSLAVTNVQSAGAEAADVARVGTTLYLATGFGGCQVWDVSAPFAPVLTGAFGNGVRAVDADMSGPYLFVAGDEGGVQVHSLTNPAGPSRLATVAGVTNARCVAVSGSLAFVADGVAGLSIYSITNPAAPVRVGSDPGTGLYTARRLAVAGARAVLTDGRQINLLDISTPSSPVLLATNMPDGYVFDLAAGTGCVFAACGGAGLKVLDKDSLTTIGSFSAPPDPVLAVAVNGDYAYIGDGRSYWRTLSITNPAAPAVVQASSGAVVGVAAVGPMTYVLSGQGEGKAFTVSAPVTPVPGAVFPRLARALRVRAQGGLMLSPEDEAGLAILNASPHDINLDGIPDTWEQQIVDAIANDAIASVWDVRPGDDFDGDGLSNGAEFLAGTVPTDAASVFVIRAALPPGGTSGQFVLRWNSVNGRHYRIYKSTDLRTGFSALPDDLIGVEPVNSYTDTVSTAAFYMLEVR